ncbi:MAG: hypothetical protein R3281_03660 [Balneolaceae bacterium]|nr:hypothetical protein [Balneolaceae bacterium]
MGGKTAVITLKPFRYRYPPIFTILQKSLLTLLLPIRRYVHAG